jgi:hypothetical protein
VVRELFYLSPGPGALVYGVSFYARAEGGEKICRRSVESRSDLIDTVEEGRSEDNGRTWTPLEPRPAWERTTGGIRRLTFLPGFVDPERGWLLEIGNECLLPHDDALEAMERNFLRCRVSADGGRTWLLDEPVVHTGGFAPERPFPGVHIGRNSIMLGDMGSHPIRVRGGELLVPVQITPLGPDGRLHNPGGGYTYHEAAVLIGTCRNDGCIDWEISERVTNDPERSTRGCIEPTLAQFPDGRVLMVLRGSNDARPELPGYRWVSVSQDEGRTWSPVQPWTHDDGEAFFSPSSMSQLLSHSNGEVYWLGNIAPENPRGNHPRYPLVIGRVDPGRLTLVRDSVTMIDDRQPGEPEAMTLSNFFAHEDRESGEILLHMSRWFLEEWRGDAYCYRIEV